MAAHASGENVVKVAEDYSLERGESVKNVTIIFGDASISGQVEGTVTVFGGTLTLGEEAVIGKDATVVMGRVSRAEGASINGTIISINIPRFLRAFPRAMAQSIAAFWLALGFMVLVGITGLAILLAALVPRHIASVVKALDRSFFPMLGFGVMWLVLIFPVGLLLLLSIIGIVIIPLEILIVGLGIVVGYVASAIFIGSHVIGAFKKEPIPFLDAVIGIAILFIIGLVPMAGTAIQSVFVIAGFGAALSTRFGSMP